VKRTTEVSSEATKGAGIQQEWANIAVNLCSGVWQPAMAHARMVRARGIPPKTNMVSLVTSSDIYQGCCIVGVKAEHCVLVLQDSRGVITTEYVCDQCSLIMRTANHHSRTCGMLPSSTLVTIFMGTLAEERPGSMPCGALS
jgi:hypothetical protein